MKGGKKRIEKQKIDGRCRFFFALLSKTDRYHIPAHEIKDHLKATWPVITEVVHLLIKRETDSIVETFIEFCERGGVEIFPLMSSHLPRIKTLMHKYRDLPMDLADASLVILAEECHISDVVSTDMRNFQTYQWMPHKPFNNLLAEVCH